MAFVESENTVLGAITSSGVEGTVELKGDAAKAESTLLVSRALQIAAQRIVAALPKLDRVLLLPKADYLKFVNYRQFSFQQAFIVELFEDAKKEAEQLLSSSEAV